MFTVRQMRYFEALVSTQHFGMAADLAGISQPALSVQIAEMEKLVGAQLFERMSKKVILTDIGRRFLPVIRDVLSRMEEFEKISANSLGPYHSPWRIGIIPTVAPYLLPQLLPAVTKSNPDLKLDIIEAHTETLSKRIGDGKLDMVIAADGFAEDGLTKKALWTDNFYLATAVDDTNYISDLPSADAVNRKRLLLLEEGHCLRNQMLEICKSGHYRQEFAATGLATILQLVSYNFGVTLIPQIACPAEHRNKSLRIRAFTQDTPKREISMFWRNRSSNHSHYESFGDLVKQAVKPLLLEAEALVKNERQAA